MQPFGDSVGPTQTAVHVASPLKVAQHGELPEQSLLDVQH
jgi:hypothetical protein